MDDNKKIQFYGGRWIEFLPFLVFLIVAIACWIFAVLYTVGVLLGCNPAVLAGAIVSGGIFGDNLAPLSDTMLCSATIQCADVGGVIKSRLKYALSAALIAIVVFTKFRGKGVTVSEVPYEMIAEYMYPSIIISYDICYNNWMV